MCRACHFAPVTIDLGDMTLTLEILNNNVIADAHGSILGGVVGDGWISYPSDAMPILFLFTRLSADQL